MVMKNSLLRTAASWEHAPRRDCSPKGAALHKALIVYYYKSQTGVRDHGTLARAPPCACPGPEMQLMLMVTCNASPKTHGSQGPPLDFNTHSWRQ